MHFEGNWAVLNVRLAHVVPMVVASATIGFATPASAAGTTAGTPIANTATATYTDPGNATQTVNSNTVTLRVDEILNVTVAQADPGTVVVTPGATGRVLAFDVTNTGNGSETFRLTPNAAVGGDQFDPSTTALYLDNPAGTPQEIGVYDANDIPYTAGSNDPNLAPDETRRVFILSTIPAGATDGDRGDVDLTATALTGTGAPGTAFPGQGQGGGDAVVGLSGAAATDRNGYVVQNASVAFVKSASVVDPFGGSRNLPGAIITYRLVATTAGSGTLTNLGISDVVPANTTYQPGTLTLESAALTDAADADAGEVITNAGTSTATIRLGNVAGGQTRTVTFQTRIN